jgi:hypothetical protein
MELGLNDFDECPLLAMDLEMDVAHIKIISSRLI